MYQISRKNPLVYKGLNNFISITSLHFIKKLFLAARTQHFVGSGLEVIKLEYSLKLKIKHNDWLLADSQSLCFILSLRLYSNFISSGPDLALSCSQRFSANDKGRH